MDQSPQIELKNVGIYYYTFNQGVNSVKDFITGFEFIRPFVKKQILSDVNLSINKGEIVGILGKNGSGKSTLLKCVAGIVKSFQGSVSVTGNIAPMLSIGSGIEMELTGIENIKLISSFLGSSTITIQERIKRIIEFSELTEEELNRQVKTYSTGMISRLSFSTAICETPDILLIDEVLAVGDAGFQQKCLDRINEIKEEGTTILFVSHGAEDVRKICTRAVCIDQGKIVMDSDVESTLKHYNKLF